MLYIQKEYVDRIAPQLDGARVISNSPYVLNFRCCFCGDSRKRLSKKRAYIYEKNGKLRFHCHNCGEVSSFNNLVKKLDHSLYLDMVFSLIKHDDEFKEPSPFVKPERKNNNFFLGTPITQSKGFDYVKSRKIPERFWRSIYYIEDMNAISKQIDASKSYPVNEAIVIPFFDKERYFSYICFRFINPINNFRYITLQRDSVLSKIWGMEYVDIKKPVYVFEGAIDAMMINNSVALGGATSNESINELKKHTRSLCFVYDNEIASNKAIRKQFEKRIAEGHSVFIADERFSEKDANAMIVKNKMSAMELDCYIKERIFSGLQATLELSYYLKWRNK